MSFPAPLFEISNLLLTRGGALVLDVPSLTLREGEVFFLLGPNGAGKSTLLQVLSALLKPSSGEVLFRGQRIGVEIPVLKHRRRLAMVLQEPLLFDTTVYNNVASGLKIRGMRKRHYESIVNETLERFGIAHLRDRSARTLSGGEARRTSIARAFATKPEVLLLDEPFSGLDSVIRETLLDDLDRVLRETRITTIFVTHDRTEAFRLGTRIGVMKDARILQTGSPNEVMNHPADAFVASLVGAENILAGKVSRQVGNHLVVVVDGQEIKAPGEAPPGESVTLCIRPENVTLSAAGSGDARSGVNRVSGTLKRVIPVGPYHKVFLNCRFPLVAYVTTRALSSLPLKGGAEVSASFERGNVHVIRKGVSSKR